MLLRGLQEVTLRRKNSDDRLGLTLYYRDAYNGTSDVIVGEVSKPAYLCEYSSIPRPTVFLDLRFDRCIFPAALRKNVEYEYFRLKSTSWRKYVDIVSNSLLMQH